MTRFAILNQLAAQIHSFFHGETVQYFRAGEHQPREYTALIERQYDQIVKEVGDLSSPAWIISLIATEDKTKGITPAQVNTDYDRVNIEIHPGEGFSERSVVRILSSHAGKTRLLIV